jgi:hypothetical protein
MSMTATDGSLAAVLPCTAVTVLGMPPSQSNTAKEE